MQRTAGREGAVDGEAVRIALEEQDVVVRVLAPLTARQRAAVVLIDLLGYSSDEAGRMLGIRPSTVRTHVERAHRDLKARMERSHG